MKLVFIESYITQVNLDAEGDQNCGATITLKNGTMLNANSCGQGSFEYSDTDEKVESWLNSLLFGLWSMMACDDYNDPDIYTHRFQSEFVPGEEFWKQVYDIKVLS